MALTQVPSEIHLIIPTHTTRFLRRTLLGVVKQDTQPDTITISSDNDDEAIRELLQRLADEFHFSCTLVRRPWRDREHLSQVRNNAVRALLKRSVSPNSSLVFLDGDCVPAPDVLTHHQRLGSGGDLVIAYRIDLTAQQTAAFDEEKLLEKLPPVPITRRQWRDLKKRHRRYIRHEILKKFHLTKRHKPKPLGGHHSVTLRIYQEINGYDEEYHSWGTEDDDFGRRVHGAGGKAVIAVRDILVFHQYHPTRAPKDWHQRHNAELFKEKRPIWCQHGLTSPLAQDAVEIIPIGPQR